VSHHELRVCFRDTDNGDALKVLAWHVSSGSFHDVETQYPVVMLAVVREQPAGNPVINEISGHDVYTAWEAVVGAETRLCVQGCTRSGQGKGVSRKVVPPVGNIKSEPVDSALVEAVACCGPVSWPSAKGITSQEENAARALLGIPT